MFNLYRKRKLDNAAALAQRPAPPSIHNHNPGTPWGVIILALFAVAVAGLVGLWWFLVYLVDLTGAREPERVLAEVILVILAAAIGLLFLAAIGRVFLNRLLDTWKDVVEIRAEAELNRLRIAQQMPPQTAERMTTEQARQYQAVKVTMARAYEMIGEDGKLKGQVQPWSRRSVGSYQLLNESEPIGENSNLATWVKPYLMETGILKNEKQVAVGRFPDLAAVEVQLRRYFGNPVLYSLPSPTPTQHERFEHI